MEARISALDEDMDDMDDEEEDGEFRVRTTVLIIIGGAVSATPLLHSQPSNLFILVCLFSVITWLVFSTKCVVCRFKFQDNTISATAPDLRSGYRDYDKPRRSPSPRYKRSRSRSPQRR